MTNIKQHESLKDFYKLTSKYRYLDIEQLIENSRKLKQEIKDLKIENAILKEKLLHQESS